MNPVLCVVGERPNVIKMAPILRAMAAHQPPLPAVLVHTGQPFDNAQSERLFDALALPRPDVNLEVGAGSHALQTAEVMSRFDPVMDSFSPGCVAVVGDVNSTLACALVARKRGVKVVQVESGLRSFERDRSEEINRILTDQIADRLYTTERSASQNLEREGIAPHRVVFAGNVVMDSVARGRRSARSARDTLRSVGLDSTLLNSPQGYGLVSLHRPSTVDDAPTLGKVLGILAEVAQRIPLVFAMHPRTFGAISRFGLAGKLVHARVALLPPQDYLEMLGLVAEARLVLTDSDGLQEETTALGVPCLTLRYHTERPITVEQGTNTLVGCDRDAILRGVDGVLSGRGKRDRVPEGWDGRAAERIVADLFRWLVPTQ